MSVAVVAPSLVAVAGVLAGGLLTYLFQGRLARASRVAGRDEARRAETVAAVAALVAGLAEHRRAMWVREEARLAGADPQVVAEARSASHITRAAITAPLATVSILAPTLAPLAQRAAQATYALRGTADLNTLNALRTSAIAATDRLVDTAALFAAHSGEVTA